MDLGKLTARLLPAALVAAVFSASGLEAQERSAGAPHAAAVMQGLDKVTARISPFDFGSLRLVLRACWKTPPEEPPESAAFLEIHEIDPDSPERRIFNGWMFASSPAVNPLEHGVYDVWVMECEDPLQ